MGTLTIVRHGNTFDRGDVILRVGGRTDLPLSQSGRQQADQLADYFSGQTFDAVLCSPLLRQAQTAQMILDRLESPDELTFEPGLTEIDYGPDEGLPEIQLIDRIGSMAMQRWETERIAPPDWKIDTDGLDLVWASLLKRARDAHLLVVTSNGTARFLFDHIDRREVPYKLRTGAFGVVDVDSQSAQLRIWDQRPSELDSL